MDLSTFKVLIKSVKKRETSAEILDVIGSCLRGAEFIRMIIIKILLVIQCEVLRRESSSSNLLIDKSVLNHRFYDDV